MNAERSFAEDISEGVFMPRLWQRLRPIQTSYPLHRRRMRTSFRLEGPA
jgi:hypothetical protein